MEPTRDKNKAYGIGDAAPDESLKYIAAAIQIGGISFADYPITTYKSAKTVDVDGLIGADLFDKFLETIDISRNQLTLDPFESIPVEELQDAPEKLPPGFFRAFRIRSHFLVPTIVNQQRPQMFLIDTGASENSIDRQVALASTNVHIDQSRTVTGVQGKVNEVSHAQNLTWIFPGFRQSNADMVAFDLTKINNSEGINIAGILGMPTLRYLKMTIDYQNGAVKMERQASRLAVAPHPN